MTLSGMPRDMEGVLSRHGWDAARIGFTRMKVTVSFHVLFHHPGAVMR